MLSNDRDVKMLLAEDEDLRTFPKWKQQGEKHLWLDCKGRSQTLQKAWERWEWIELLDGVLLYKLDPGSYAVQQHSITAPPSPPHTTDGGELPVCQRQLAEGSHPAEEEL